MTAQTEPVAAATFCCTKCEAVFPWAAGHVGRLAKCKCGQVLKVPPQPIEGPTFVEAARAAAAPAPVTAAPLIPALPTTTSSIVDPPSSLPPSLGLSAPPPPLAASRTKSAHRARANVSATSNTPDNNAIPDFLRMGARDPETEKLDAQTEAELAEISKYGEQDVATRFKYDPIRDFKAPVGLLVAGLVLTFIGFNHGGAIGAVFATVATGFYLVVSLVLFLIGGLIAARLAGIYLGEVGPALLKLGAVSVFPAALADLITKLLGGDMAVACLGNGAGIVTCWFLVSYLFRLDGMNTLIVVGTVAVVKFVLQIVLFGMLMIMIGSFMPGAPGGYSDGEMSEIDAAMSELESETSADDANDEDEDD